MDIPRKFVCLDNVSKFLYCSICDDIFRNPIRLKTCGHTYCMNCILQWGKHNFNCPLCRVNFTDKDIRTDIIASNIINDLEIYCIYSGCPWKGRVADIEAHLANCYFNPKEIPDYIKEVLSERNSNDKKKNNNEKEENNSDGDGDEDSEGFHDNNLTSFNTKSSLRARLYNRNRELFNNVYSKSMSHNKKNKIDNKNESEILKILRDNNISF